MDNHNHNNQKFLKENNLSWKQEKTFSASIFKLVDQQENIIAELIFDQNKELISSVIDCENPLAEGIFESALFCNIVLAHKSKETTSENQYFWNHVEDIHTNFDLNFDVISQLVFDNNGELAMAEMDFSHKNSADIQKDFEGIEFSEFEKCEDCGSKMVNLASFGEDNDEDETDFEEEMVNSSSFTGKKPELLN